MPNITDILRDMLNEDQAVDEKENEKIVEDLNTKIKEVKEKLTEENIDPDVIVKLEEELKNLETQLSEAFPQKKKDDDGDEDEDKKDKKDKKPFEKKDDDEDDDMKESLDMTVHIDAIKNLFSDQDLSEETVEKLTTLFTVAVNSTVNEKIKEAKATLEEEFNSTIVESIKEIDEKVNTYISYAAEEYLKENEIAIEQGIKSELVESFLSGMKELFDEHYVEIPDEKVGVVEELGHKLQEAEEKMDILIEENISSKIEINKFKKSKVFSELSEGMIETDKEKLNALVEDIEYTDKESFSEKVNTLKENYLFSQKENKDNKSKLNEGVEDKKTTPSNMDIYLKTVSNPVFK